MDLNLKVQGAQTFILVQLLELFETELMNNALMEYLKEFNEALSSENYESIAKLLKIDEENSLSVGGKRKQSMTLKKKLFTELSQREDINSLSFYNYINLSSSKFNESELEIWNSIIWNHLKVLKELNSNGNLTNKCLNATNDQFTIINLFLRIFSTSSQLPVLYVLGNDTWKLAVQSESSESQEQAARAINRLFISCITERSALSHQSRKWGTYQIGALLLRIYFHLGQLNLVQNVLKALQACELPEIDRFPRAHTVTFKFFLGRYHFGREEFEAAEKCFTFCFENINNSSMSNTIKNNNTGHFSQLDQIINYLIPIKFILHLARPTDQLIALISNSNNQQFYKNLIDFITVGDVSAFKNLLKLNYKQLFKSSSFGVYENLILLVLRQMIRRIHRLNDNSTRIPLSVICNLFEKDTNSVNVTCLVANVIAKGLIRGYISEEKQFLVLSSQNPFPINLNLALCEN